MAEVIGAAFLGPIKHVKEKKGAEFLDVIVETAGAVTQNALMKRIITVGWYPYEAYAKLITAIDKHMGLGDLSYCRKLGIIAAERDVQTVYKMYGEGTKPDRVPEADLPVQ